MLSRRLIKINQERQRPTEGEFIVYKYLFLKFFMKEDFSFLKKIKGVEAAILFGSHATKSQTPMSDIDLCIIGDISLENKKKIRHSLSEKFDISFFDNLPIWIKMRVLREGKPLFVRNKKRLLDLTFKILKEYLDFQPVIKSFINERFENQ